MYDKVMYHKTTRQKISLRPRYCIFQVWQNNDNIKYKKKHMKFCANILFSVGYFVAKSTFKVKRQVVCYQRMVIARDFFRL